MGKLVFQATLGGQVNLVGPNTASTYDINVPAVAGNMVTTGDTGTVTNTMCATSVYTAPGTIGSGTPNSGAFTTLSSSGNTTLGDASADTVTVNGKATFNASPVINVTDNTNAALRITQLGTGNALLVEDSSNPDATPFVIDASGNVGIGTSSPTVALDVVSTNANFTRTGTTSATNPFSFALQRQRSGGAALLSGDVVGQYLFRGFDGTNYIDLGWVRGEVDGTPGTNDMPGRLVFSTTADGASSPTERMRIDSSGNVGIGTSSPAYKLDVSGSVSASSATFSNFGSATTAVVALADGNTGLFRPAANTLGITVNGAERARIDSSGNLLVGTTTQVRSGDRVSIKGAGSQVATFQNDTNTSGYSAISTIIQPSGNNTSTYHLWANTNGVGNWYLYGNGTSSFSSDERLKKNIETARDGYVGDLCKLRVVKYNWKDSADETPKELGLIAQEVEQVFPNLVQDDINPVEEGGETYKQLKASVLPFMLLKAIQEQQAIIEQLKADVAALKAPQ